MADFFNKLFSFLRQDSTGHQPATRKTVDQRLKQIQTTREQDIAEAYRRRAEELTEQQRLQERAKTEEVRREGDPIWRLVHRGDVQQGFASSNVTLYWYEISERKLYVQYHDGGLYYYEGISEPEVISFHQSASKGTWVWDNLRIRGTKLGARKEYGLVASGERGRRWEETPKSAQDHSTKVAEQSGSPNNFQRLGKFQRDKPLTNKGRRKRKH